MVKSSQEKSQIRTIEPALVPWLQEADVRALMQAIGAEHARFVGGAVRDSLIGRPVMDIDLATDLTPEEVMARLQDADIKALPMGIEHGTVTAIAGERHLEITTLRYDVKTHGRRADVAFHADWEADAARRDFTMNALYMDMSGNIFDYFDGISDLMAGRVRFIGDAHARIREDGLRILRFFRFHAHYGLADENGVQAQPDEAGLAAVAAEANMLDFVSAERIRDELLKLLCAGDPVPTLRHMQAAGVLQHILDNVDLNRLATLVAVEGEVGMVNIWARLITLLPHRTLEMREQAKALRLSNQQVAHLGSILHPDPMISPSMDQAALRRVMYRHDQETFTDSLFLSAGPGDGARVVEILNAIAGVDIPDFPITGEDLLQMGFPQGPALGAVLAKLEQTWIESEFTLTKSDLMDLAQQKTAD